MTYAELLRKYATDATNEGGMWFSGEYMTVLASIAESIEAENAKLREVVDIFIHCIGDLHSCYTCQVKGNPYDFQHDWGACDELRDMLVDMGFEVPDAENA